MIIRDLSQEDLYDVLHLCKKFYKKAKFEDLGKLNQEKTLQYLVSLLHNPETLCKVVEDDGEIEGFAAFALVESPFSDSIIGYELFFWLNTKNPFTAKKIIKEYEEWAKEKGCIAVRFGSIHSLEDEKFISFITRQGFHKKETFFIKGI